ncbi:MAG TPA: hypothetical protein VKB50_27815 [Vicinamibacterales bacterium]|nr:hypothetical protein [Vicinamibacterales bacterium]
MAYPEILIAADQNTSQYSPSFSPGYLIAWIVCNSKKRNPIGGWLLLFYWQLYSGLFLTALVFAASIQNYVPENFDSSQHMLWLASNVPPLLLFACKCSVATLLLTARTWDMLRLLRWVMVAELLAAVIGMGIDVAYFPDNVALGFLTVIPDIIWLAYMFRSTRIAHVFKLQDWAIAVDTIHPLKLKAAT